MSLSLKCRSCGSTDAAQVLDLGLQPLANNLLTSADLTKKEPKFPLRLAVCKSCWMLQITDLVPPVELFSEYLYFSSFSDLMLRLFIPHSCLLSNVDSGIPCKRTDVFIHSHALE